MTSGASRPLGNHALVTVETRQSHSNFNSAIRERTDIEKYGSDWYTKYDLQRWRNMKLRTYIDIYIRYSQTLVFHKKHAIGNICSAICSFVLFLSLNFYFYLTFNFMFLIYK